MNATNHAVAACDSPLAKRDFRNSRAFDCYTTMISALVGHLVGDYLIQNDWMALNKKKSTPICAVHCVLWATAVCLFAWWPLWTWPVLFATHFIQDRTNVIGWWMKTVGQEQFASGPCSPWSIIVVDNVWHIVTIWAIWHVV